MLVNGCFVNIFNISLCAWVKLNCLSVPTTAGDDGIEKFLSTHDEDHLRDVSVEEMRHIIPKLFMYCDNRDPLCRRGLFESVTVVRITVILLSTSYSTVTCSLACANSASFILPEYTGWAKKPDCFLTVRNSRICWHKRSCAVVRITTSPAECR